MIEIKVEDSVEDCSCGKESCKICRMAHEIETMKSKCSSEREQIVYQNCLNVIKKYN